MHSLHYGVIGLEENRRPGRTEFAAAEYRVFCPGAEEGKREREELDNVGLGGQSRSQSSADDMDTGVHQRALHVNDLHPSGEIECCHI